MYTTPQHLQTVSARSLPWNHPLIVRKRRRRFKQQLFSLIPNPKHFGLAYKMGGICATVISFLYAFFPHFIAYQGLGSLFIFLDGLGIFVSLFLIVYTKSANGILGSLLGIGFFLGSIAEIMHLSFL